MVFLGALDLACIDIRTADAAAGDICRDRDRHRLRSSVVRRVAANSSPQGEHSPRLLRGSCLLCR